MYSENVALPGSLPGDTVFDAMRDRDGGLWFATFEGGIAQLPPQWRNFAVYRNDPGNAQSPERKSSTAGPGRLDAQGGIWSVTAAGAIDRLDTTNGRVERYGERWGSSDKALWSVLADSAGQLWVGHTRGVRVYDLRNGEFSDLPVDAKRADALAPGQVDYLTRAQDGAIWASANGGGVQRIDAASHRIERFDENTAGLAQRVDQPTGVRSGWRVAGRQRHGPGSARPSEQAFRAGRRCAGAACAGVRFRSRWQLVAAYDWCARTLSRCRQTAGTARAYRRGSGLAGAHRRRPADRCSWQTVGKQCARALAI